MKSPKLRLVKQASAGDPPAPSPPALPPAATTPDKAAGDYRLHARIGLAVIAVCFGVFGLWAAFAPLGAAVMGPGYVAVESSRKTVQHLEGGIVRRILVREGDTVRAGQVLFELDPVQPSANLSIVRHQYFTARARLDRLSAERGRQAAVTFSPEVVQAASDPLLANILQDESRQFLERRATLTGQTGILQSRIGQLSEQVRGIEQQTTSMRAEVNFLNEEIEGLRELYEQELVPKPRLLALERERARISGQIGRLTAERAQTQKSIGEAQLQIRQIQQEFSEDVSKQMAEAQSQASDLREKFSVARDVAKRITITAPVSGTAQNLRVFTEGAVIRPADPLVDIAPGSGDLIVQAQFSPTDVDALHPGMRTELRFPSFHIRRLPVIKGTVQSVSRDRLIDETTRQPYFLVIVRLRDADIPSVLKGKLTAGMPAEVIVPTSERTALEYILSPLTNALPKAMREE